MDKTTPEDLRAAYKREKDPKVIKRMATVNMVCMNDESIKHTADSLMQCSDWVSMWVEHFKVAWMPFGIFLIPVGHQR